MLDRRILAGAVLLLAGVGALLVALGSRPERERGGAGSELVKSEREEPRAELVPAEVSPVAVARERERASRQDEPEPAGRALAGANAPPGLTRLRGVLLRALDRAPVSRNLVVFHFGEDSADAVTDEHGRFETEAVVPAGVVRAYHVGDEGYTGFGQHRELEPTMFVVPASSAPEPVHELELLLREPAAVLDVQVVKDGVPARATVLVTVLQSRAWPDATDELGRLHVAFNTLEPNAEIRLVARAEPFTSPVVGLRFPWPDEVVVLELRPAGAIHVRAVEPSGRPLPGQFVRLSEYEGGERTDEKGEVTFSAVLAGPATVEADGATPRTVEVRGGEVAEVELVMHKLRLVAGTVVDENGKGLARIRVVVGSKYTSTTLVTKSDGTFDVRWVADDIGDLVHVEVGLSPYDDRYEPEELAVPPGTSDLVIRRVDSRPEIEVAFALVDARTKEPLEGGRVILVREGHDWGEATPARDGLALCTFKPFDDVLAVGRAEGYRDARIAWRELARGDRGGEPVTLALEPGFEQPLVLVDCESNEPIVGARVFLVTESGEEPLALTDGEGRAQLSLPRWPETLRVVADGYEDDTLDLADYLDEAVLWFCLDGAD